MCYLPAGMAVFRDCFVLLELKSFPFQEKKKLKSCVTENGGHVSYVVNEQVTGISSQPVLGLCRPRQRQPPAPLPTVLSGGDGRHVRPELQPAARRAEARHAGGGRGLRVRLSGERPAAAAGRLPAGHLLVRCLLLRCLLARCLLASSLLGDTSAARTPG